MPGPLIESLARQGITRRTFLKYCATLASMMALPPSAGRAMAEAMAAARRPSVIWLPFQECTGCTESITRSHSPTIEGMIFDMISLDYQETLMAAAGHQAEAARLDAMQDNAGKYLLIVDGSVPLGLDGAYSCIGGRSNVEMLKEAAQGAAAIVAVGTCAAFGGIPKANPNPTGAVPVSDIVKDRPIVNIPGCPPIPVVMTGVLAHYLTFGSLPELAKTFDDEGARNGWCLFELGCKGPVTHNACATAKWNGGTSWPVESGHGCLGCSEPDFWDAGGFYKALSVPADPLRIAGVAAAAGAAVGVGLSFANRAKKGAAKKAHQPVTLADLEKS
ncbi:MAG: Ni/Fe hydrogenase [Thiobacillus sp. SCN 63-1177]|nr:MAG: Ni/Fe hydrogenase [Thiobacillus sp. SCN 63-1177]